MESNKDELRTLAASLTKSERCIIINRGFTADGKVTLPGRRAGAPPRIIDLGSWAAAMDLREACFAVGDAKAKPRAPGGKLRSEWARKAYRAGLIG